MHEILTNTYRLLKAKISTAADRAELIAKQVHANAMNYAITPDGQRFRRPAYGYSAGWRKAGEKATFDDTQSLPWLLPRNVVMRNCRKLVLTNPYAQLVIAYWRAMILGIDGIGVQVEGNDNVLKQKIQDYLIAWRKTVDYAGIMESVITRSLTDSDVYLTFIEGSDLFLRFLEPEYIQTLNQAPSCTDQGEQAQLKTISSSRYIIDGVEYENGIEARLHYIRGTQKNVYERSQYESLKLLDLPGSPRGYPGMAPVMNDLAGADSVTRKAQTMVEYQARILMLRELPPGYDLSQAQTSADAERDASVQDADRQAYDNVQFLDNSSIVIDMASGMNLKYMNVVSTEPMERIIARMLMAAGAGSGVPNSSVNPGTDYKSMGEMSERIGLIRFAQIGSKYGRLAVAIHRKAIEFGIAKGKLPKEAAQMDLSYILPDNEYKDWDKKVDSYIKLAVANKISDQTLRRDLGFDNNQEEAQIENEMKKEIEGLEPPEDSLASITNADDRMLPQFYAGLFGNYLKACCEAGEQRTMPISTIHAAFNQWATELFIKHNIPPANKGDFLKAAIRWLGPPIDATFTITNPFAE